MEMIGLLGLWASDPAQAFPEAQAEELSVLAERASVSLTDRLLQREIFTTMDRLLQRETINDAFAHARVQALTAPG
jgi:hypothetical protein